MEVRHQFHVGVNIFLVREGKLLLGKRKNIYGDGTWGLPGGHLEPGEEMFAAAARELFEETGLTASSYAFSNLVNNHGNEKHYLQVGFVAEGWSGEPELKEADCCAGWQWFSLTALPLEIFSPHKSQIEAFMKGSLFSD